MSWLIVLPIGIIIGILFSSAYPDMASAINETVFPPLQAAGDILAERMKEGVLSILR